jgi:uncharacterized membrane protein
MNFKQRLTNVLTILLGVYSILLAIMIIGSRTDITPEEMSFIFNTSMLIVANATLSYLMGMGFKLWHRKTK